MMALRRAALALLVLLAGLAPATGAERILSFISDVKVLTNSDLLVTETIRIQAEGDAFKHGLLRDFPTTYTRRNGTRVRVRRSVCDPRWGARGVHHRAQGQWR
jgi:hypothetical protein